MIINSIMDKKPEQNQEIKKETDENISVSLVVEHLLIQDVETGEIIMNKRV